MLIISVIFSKNYVIFLLLLVRLRFFPLFKKKKGVHFSLKVMLVIIWRNYILEKIYRYLLGMYLHILMYAMAKVLSAHQLHHTRTRKLVIIIFCFVYYCTFILLSNFKALYSATNSVKINGMMFFAYYILGRYICIILL